MGMGVRKKHPQQQTCKVCSQPDKFNFYVPDAIWNAVVPSLYRERVVCLYCFDEFARETNVEYASQLSTLVFAGNRASFEFQVVRGTSVTH